jgi:hypothetical protein
MGFREDWQERQTVALNELHQAVAQAREQWLGRRVWVWANRVDRLYRGYMPEWQYGEVESVEDNGRVKVLYGYTDTGHAVFCSFQVVDLGRLVVLAEE